MTGKNLSCSFFSAIVPRPSFCFLGRSGDKTSFRGQHLFAIFSAVSAAARTGQNAERCSWILHCRCVFLLAHTGHVLNVCGLHQSSYEQGFWWANWCEEAHERNVIHYSSFQLPLQDYTKFMHLLVWSFQQGFSQDCWNSVASRLLTPLLSPQPYTCQPWLRTSLLLCKSFMAIPPLETMLLSCAPWHISRCILGVFPVHDDVTMMSWCHDVMMMSWCHNDVMMSQWCHDDVMLWCRGDERLALIRTSLEGKIWTCVTWLLFNLQHDWGLPAHEAEQGGSDIRNPAPRVQGDQAHGPQVPLSCY